MQKVIKKILLLVGFFVGGQVLFLDSAALAKGGASSANQTTLGPVDQKSFFCKFACTQEARQASPEINAKCQPCNGIGPSAGGGAEGAQLPPPGNVPTTAPVVNSTVRGGAAPNQNPANLTNDVSGDGSDDDAGDDDAGDDDAGDDDAGDDDAGDDDAGDDDAGDDDAGDDDSGDDDA